MIKFVFIILFACFPDGKYANTLPSLQSCGISRIPQNGDRIVGGRNAAIGEFPWQASVRYKKLFIPLTHLCGASILNEHWLITAAHCLYSRPKNNFDVVVGINSQNEKNITKQLVDKFVIHEKFNPATFLNDIALIRVKNPIPFNNRTNGICLPFPEEIMNGFVTATGWGAIKEDGGMSNLLQAVDVPIVPQDICETLYGPEIFSKDAMMCAGEPHGKVDSCQGDSGGPLIQWRGNRAVLAGIVSWGIGCARPSLPGVYTRVSRYIPWIQEHTR